MGNTESPLDWIARELESLQRAGLRRTLVARSGLQGPTILLNGRELVNFGSNDYLGLAADRRLVIAARDALQEVGWGGGASPLVTGYSEFHRRLEARLAEFEGTEAALSFGSGYAANTGTIAALAGPGDVVFTDRKNHASILDGCRLSRADVRPYPHGDWQELGQLLGRTAAARRRLIVTDSVFSMDGDLAPLTELAELADRHGAMLMVDEAHATGVFGDRGRGVAEWLELEDRVHVRMGTLSKALGSIGGFVVGSRPLIDWLANRARSFVFSTASPAAAAAAGLAALDIVREEPERRRTLLERASAVRRAVAAQGWNVGQSASQIVPLVVGTPEAALRLSASLGDRGLFVPAIRPPTVPEGEACLRISLSWAHSPEMINRLLEGLAELAG